MHTHSYMHTHIHARTHTHIHTLMYTRTQTHIHTHIHIHTHTLKYTHTHTHTYIHTYIHTLSLSLSHTHTYTHVHAYISAHLFKSSRTWGNMPTCKSFTIISLIPSIHLILSHLISSYLILSHLISSYHLHANFHVYVISTSPLNIFCAHKNAHITNIFFIRQTVRVARKKIDTMELYIAGSELPENPVVDIDFSFDDDEMLDEEMRADKELEVKMVITIMPT
jgi:hypothetical protein